MPNSFQQGADQGANNQDPQGQGTSFGQQNQGDNLSPPADEVTPTITAEDLATLTKRDEHAQGHIQTLEDEAKDLKTLMVEMQEKLDKAASVGDLLKDQGQQSAIDVDELTAKTVQAVKANLTAEQQEVKATENFDKVSTALTEKFGEKTDEAVKAACSENDMSFDEMVSLARKNPNLAMKLCDVKVKAEPQASLTSINTNAFQQNNQDLGQPQKVDVMNLRTDRERVDNFNSRLDAKLKELNN